MDKAELLEHAKVNQLKDDKDKLIYRFHARKSEEEIRALVKDAEGIHEEAEEQETEDIKECEFFGNPDHFGTREECSNCPDDLYNACGDKADGK